jgi:hypothetical protein
MSWKQERFNVFLACISRGALYATASPWKFSAMFSTRVPLTAVADGSRHCNLGLVPAPRC